MNLATIAAAVGGTQISAAKSAYKIKISGYTPTLKNIPVIVNKDGLGKNQTVGYSFDIPVRELIKWYTAGVNNMIAKSRTGVRIDTDIQPKGYITYFVEKGKGYRMLLLNDRGTIIESVNELTPNLELQILPYAKADGQLWMSTHAAHTEFPKLVFRKTSDGRYQAMFQLAAKQNPVTSVVVDDVTKLFPWAYLLLEGRNMLHDFGITEVPTNVKKSRALASKLKSIPPDLKAEEDKFMESKFRRYVETSVHAGSEKVLSKETIQKLDAYFDSNFRKVSDSECRAYVTSRVELIFTPSDKKDFKVSVSTAGGQYGKDKIYSIAKSKHANTTDLSAITKAADLFDEALIKFARI